MQEEKTQLLLENETFAEGQTLLFQGPGDSRLIENKTFVEGQTIVEKRIKNIF